MNNFYYKSRGNITCGFLCDRIGNPYLLAFITYGAPGDKTLINLLDNYKGFDNIDDRGREFQSCLLDGFIDHTAGDDFYVDTTNPTFGGGNYGKAVPTILEIIETSNTLEVTVPAYDYMPENFGGVTKSYKARMLANRYPATGWNCWTKYTIEENSVLMENAYFITDNQPHHVYFYRPVILHLNPVIFDHNLENESKRDFDSFLQAVINDDKIMAWSTEGKIKVILTGEVTSPINYPFYFSHRCFRQADRTVPAPPGTDDVWEAMIVTEPNNWFNSSTFFKGWGRIEFISRPQKRLDLARFIKELINYKAKKKEEFMKVSCSDEVLSITSNEFAWLKLNGHLEEVTFPHSPDIGYFNGTAQDLRSLLDQMPLSWEPSVVTPPVEPVGPTLSEIIEDLDYLISGLNEVKNKLKELK